MEGIPQIVLPELKYYEIKRQYDRRQQINAFFVKEKVQKDIIGIQVVETKTDANTENKKEDDDDDIISVLEKVPAVNDDNNDIGENVNEKRDANKKTGDT